MTAGSTNSTDRLSTVYESPQTRGVGGINLSGLCALYVLTLRQHMHGKRWIIMALLFLLPAALALVARMTTGGREPPIQFEFGFVFMFLPHVILPLVALIYASGIIHDEQEEQTITYLLIRPIPKWAIYFVKLLATLTTTVVLTAVFTALTYAVIYFGTASDAENFFLRVGKAITVHSLAMVTYCCLFGLFGLLTKRVLVAGILYIVAIEGVFANLPFGIRYVTVIYYTRIIAYHMMSFLLPRYGQTINMASDAWQLDADKDPTLLAHPQVSTCLTVLLVASLVSTIAAAVICSRREFHVKTPEKE
jgi:ABC-2 type transport system permease protein